MTKGNITIEAGVWTPLMVMIEGIKKDTEVTMRDVIEIKEKQIRQYSLYDKAIIKNNNINAAFRLQQLEEYQSRKRTDKHKIVACVVALIFGIPITAIGTGIATYMTMQI